MPVPAQPQTIVKISAKERVLQTLRQWIVDGTLQPGERLNDAELAAYFGVSRTPVREALQELSRLKLVVFAPSSGTFVAPIDRKDLAHVYSLLRQLQLMALLPAMDSLTEEFFSSLTDLNDAFLHNARYETPLQVMESDRLFHRKLFELAENPYLTAFAEDLMLQTHRCELQIFTGNTRGLHSYSVHRHLIEALERKDKAQIEALLTDDWSLPPQSLSHGDESRGRFY